MTRVVVLGGGFAGPEAIRVLERAEHADHEPNPERRRRMPTVCVVGGGYTGVELIAELRDFFHSYVVPRYRGIDARDCRLLLVEAGEAILRGVHPALAERALRRLAREGVEVMIRARVTRVLPGGVELEGGRQVPCGVARIFPRDSAMMREAARCPICRAHAARAAGRDAA
jgi:NADH dehydrogenase FAD-containing subunit